MIKITKASHKCFCDRHGYTRQKGIFALLSCRSIEIIMNKRTVLESFSIEPGGFLLFIIIVSGSNQVLYILGGYSRQAHSLHRTGKCKEGRGAYSYM